MDVFTVLGLTFAVFRLADMEAVQMLQRFSQVGEVYVASKPDGVDATSRACLAGGAPLGGSRETVVGILFGFLGVCLL